MACRANSRVAQPSGPRQDRGAARRSENGSMRFLGSAQRLPQPNIDFHSDLEFTFAGKEFGPEFGTDKAAIGRQQRVGWKGGDPVPQLFPYARIERPQPPVPRQTWSDMKKGRQ